MTGDSTSKPPTSSAPGFEAGGNSAGATGDTEGRYDLGFGSVPRDKDNGTGGQRNRVKTDQKTSEGRRKGNQGAVIVGASMGGLVGFFGALFLFRCLAIDGCFGQKVADWVDRWCM